ncbi:MAG: DUF2007 domain-containing protein [Thermodesulfobacteriota bacterium]|nr:DUF2007 domain-containing protein [Thermodesulfobacteriota bacterium]
MKTVITPENHAEASAIKAVLAEHNIHAEIQSFHDTAYDGLFQAQKGWGVVNVAEDDVDAARHIIEEWQNAAPDDLPWDET